MLKTLPSTMVRQKPHNPTVVFKCMEYDVDVCVLPFDVCPSTMHYKGLELATSTRVPFLGGCHNTITVACRITAL